MAESQSPPFPEGKKDPKSTDLQLKGSPLFVSLKLLVLVDFLASILCNHPVPHLQPQIGLWCGVGGMGSLSTSSDPWELL